MRSNGTEANLGLVRIIIWAVVLGVVFGGVISGFAYWSVASADLHQQGDAIMGAQILLGRASYPFGTPVESLCRQLFASNDENAMRWFLGSLPVIVNGTAWTAVGMGAVVLARRVARR